MSSDRLVPVPLEVESIYTLFRLNIKKDLMHLKHRYAILVPVNAEGTHTTNLDKAVYDSTVSPPRTFA